MTIQVTMMITIIEKTSLMQNLDVNHLQAVGGQQGDYSLCEGCSPFFINSSILSLITGKKSRDAAIANAKDDIAFARQLQKTKEEYEDWKEAEERALKLWLRDQKRDFARKIAYEKLNKDLAEADLKMFFADWPLQISVEALLKELYQKRERTMPMRFVIGRLYAGSAKDALSYSYPNIVDNVTTLLQEMGITTPCVYRFKECPTVVGGPALANIYAMMSSFPVVVILPMVDNRLKKLKFAVGCWTIDSPFPFQKNVLSIDFNQQRVNSDKAYLDATILKFTYACATLAAVLYDTYNLSEGVYSCVFPKFAAAKTLRNRYPELTDFAIGEFRAFMNPTTEVITDKGKKLKVWDEVNPMQHRETEKIVKESITLIEG